MTLKHGQKIEIYRISEDEAWEPWMDSLVGLHGVVTDPDTTINDPDDLVEVSVVGRGTFRLPQDCLRVLPQP